MAKKGLLTRMIELFSRLVWLGVLAIVLSLLGQYLTARSAQEEPVTVRTKPIQKPAVNWNIVHGDIRVALSAARQQAEATASNRVDAWIGVLSERVDTDFLPWYFDYWNQQMLGLSGLYQSVLHYFDPGTQTAAERVTEEIQEQFANRVLRPETAQLELEGIITETVNVYVDNLREHLDRIPERYDIPPEAWDRYLEAVAVISSGTEGNRQVPLTLKALTATTAGGAVLLAKPLKAAAAKVGTKVSAKLAAKSTAKMAAKTGQKVAAKAGGKFLGPIIGIGIIAWDVIDHQETRAKYEPVLRDNIHGYLDEVRDALIFDPETGVVTVIFGIENAILGSLEDGPLQHRVR